MATLIEGRYPRASWRSDANKSFGPCSEAETNATFASWSNVICLWKIPFWTLGCCFCDHQLVACVWSRILLPNKIWRDWNNSLNHLLCARLDLEMLVFKHKQVKKSNDIQRTTSISSLGVPLYGVQRTLSHVSKPVLSSGDSELQLWPVRFGSFKAKPPQNMVTIKIHSHTRLFGFPNNDGTCKKYLPNKFGLLCSIFFATSAIVDTTWQRNKSNQVAFLQAAKRWLVASSWKLAQMADKGFSIEENGTPVWPWKTCICLLFTPRSWRQLFRVPLVFTKSKSLFKGLFLFFSQKVSRTAAFGPASVIYASLKTSMFHVHWETHKPGTNIENRKLQFIWHISRGHLYISNLNSGSLATS